MRGGDVLRSQGERLFKLPHRQLLPVHVHVIPVRMPCGNLHIVVPCNQMRFVQCWVLLPVHAVNFCNATGLPCWALL